MAEIASWNGHSFCVSATLIRSFTDLTIKSSSETEEKTKGSQKYVKRKNSKPAEISLTVELNAFTGCDVKNEALKFIDEARNGAKGYFYLHGKKLITCQLMLIEASVSETKIASNGKWVSSKVKLVMVQCSKYDGTTGGTSLSGKASSKKVSVKKAETTTVVKPAPSPAANEIFTAISKGAASFLTTAKNMVLQVMNESNNAKKVSAASKETSVAGKIYGGSSKVTMTLR